MNRYYIVMNKQTNTFLHNENNKGIKDCQPFFTSMSEAQMAIEEYLEFDGFGYEDIVMFSVEAPRVHKATVTYNVDGEVL